MRRTSTVLALCLLASCSTEGVGARTAAVNGMVDTDEAWAGVLGMQITKPEGVASCTGVLIAPNLVLTARHCVSSTARDLICGSAPLAPPVDGSMLLSTNDVTIVETSVAVRGLRVEVPREGDDECGFDIAAVILQSEVPGARVYPPRLDRDVMPGETFTAVGYGTTGSTGIGTRRFQPEVPVVCVGRDCAEEFVQDTEWQSGDDAFCRSDSGAPAIDADGFVLGVVSKGINPCSTPIVSSAYAWRDWIRSVGRMAAEEGGYAPAAWALEPVPDAGPADAGASDASEPGDAGLVDTDSGWAAGGTGHAGLWLLVAFGTVIRRRNA